MTTLKRTPLFERYKQKGAKTVDFGGWEMPVQFSSILEEHEATRTKAGLFDVSHMGEIHVSGAGAEDFLQSLLTNDIKKLTPNRAQYTVMCYENGGTVDDLIVYKYSDSSYLLVVNAANTDKDFQWVNKHAPSDVSVQDVSGDYVQLALQGPKAEAILQRLTDTKLDEIKFFRFEPQVTFHGVNGTALVSRTGYTGEDGFEIYLSPEGGQKLWDAILAEGETEGVVPVGLGARDTLRFEANLALYGQELSSEITPIEAGIGFAVKTDGDEEFIGKSVLKEQKDNGAKRKLVGIEMIDKGIPRNGYAVFVGEEEIGFVTSGTQSPTLKKNVGLALIQAPYAELGNEVTVQVRKRKLQAQIVRTPFYKRNK
ncbi:glycine cleavage system protein T [Pontibacillus halophilus JSM 076056 = DSM 19796]|uniref:Aminomethyltransferase n=1 Tax=Pontibacillus halophilus JSM 076056 = DSM 19796 TaxID=1385510 RepID=A0A0A5GFU2_9BACI|nr:glycine cleavage system aminomethyltransferase GcvT [Pontibacillus halophilus]KGX90884.1 glycine cleavage system protein T [Pontibacillus halophilus JSM 076056 = DSM 19796]